MASGQRVVWLLFGVGAAIGVALALPQPASAQILDPPAREKSTPRRPMQPPADPADTPQDESAGAFYDGSLGVDGWKGVVVPTAAPAEDGDLEVPTPDGLQQDASAGAGADDGDDEFGEAEARPRRVSIPQDGDPVSVFEPTSTEADDGVIDLKAPNVVVGEEDPTLVDLRSPGDIAALSGAMPGFDPLLLQALETNPVFSNVQGALFEPEPFAPLGTRIGSFILFTSVEADGDYNSNLFASPVPVGDTSLEVRPAGRLVSDWSAHAIELRASGDLSYHNLYPSEDDRAYLVEGLGRLDVTRFTNLQGAVSHEEAQESRSAINASSAGTRPDVVVDRGRAAVNHRFNRLSVQLRGGITDTSYGNNIFDGQPVSNADRNFTLYEEAFRPKWEFTPTFFLFADFAFNQRNYSIPAFSDGLIRTSTGERYRAGVSFGDSGEFLRGDVSLGYGQQTPDSPQLEVIDGLLFDANLTWRPTALTTVLFTAATEVAETTTFDSGGVLERTYAAEVRHSFMTRLIGIAGLGFFTRDFVGAGLNEDQLTAATGLEYYLNRHAVLFGRYQHTVFDTSSPNGNYTVEEVQLGVRLRQ